MYHTIFMRIAHINTILVIPFANMLKFFPFFSLYVQQFSMCLCMPRLVLFVLLLFFILWVAMSIGRFCFEFCFSSQILSQSSFSGRQNEQCSPNTHTYVHICKQHWRKKKKKYINKTNCIETNLTRVDLTKWLNFSSLLSALLEYFHFVCNFGILVH